MTTGIIDIKGLNKTAVLVALYNASKAQGSGFRNFDPTPITEEEADKHLELNSRNEGTRHHKIFIDYLKGRIMKIDLAKDNLRVFDYNYDNGPGAAENALKQAGLL